MSKIWASQLEELLNTEINYLTQKDIVAAFETEYGEILSESYVQRFLTKNQYIKHSFYGYISPNNNEWLNIRSQLSSEFIRHKVTSKKITMNNPLLINYPFGREQILIDLIKKFIPEATILKTENNSLLLFDLHSSFSLEQFWEVWEECKISKKNPSE